MNDLAEDLATESLLERPKAALSRRVRTLTLIVVGFFWVSGGIYGEIVEFSSDLRGIPVAEWSEYSAFDVRQLWKHSHGMVKLQRLEMVGRFDKYDANDSRGLAKGMLWLRPSQNWWWVPIEEIVEVLVV